MNLEKRKIKVLVVKDAELRKQRVAAGATAEAVARLQASAALQAGA